MKSHRVVRNLALGMAVTLAATIVLGQTVTVTVGATGKVITTPAPTGDPLVGPQKPGRAVDLVICLDTSGSMTALIDSARAKLWDVVNELAVLKPTPTLRVGLLTYGSPNRSTAAQGWVMQHTNLTSDLDTVYARMMEIGTTGGDEFVGWVLNDALRRMSWNDAPNALKLIFVAGNESADQASNVFNFRHVASEARAAGITINAIYAGNRQNGISEHWDQVAQHGGGEYLAIDMQAGIDQIATPQDRILIELNAKLNATYVPFGKAGAVGKANQVEQDASASHMGIQTCGSRISAKATTIYDNAVWDLVDAEAKDDFDLAQVKNEDLPAPMQKMTPAEKKVYVEGMRRSRKAVQKEIEEVSKVRERVIRTEQQKRHPGKKSLDEAIRETIRKQVKGK